MANGVLIIGPSGSGKSTGIRNLDPTQTFIINPDRKPLPVKGWKSQYKTVKTSDGKVDLTASNYIETDDPGAIVRLMDFISKNRPEIKVIIIDTINHVMTSEFIKKAGISGFGKWTDFAVNIYNVIKAISDIRPDITVFLTGHNEVSFDAEGGKVSQLRTLGKLLNEKINIESMFTTVLFTVVDPKDKNCPYGFNTQTDGTTTAKSPMGMFNSVNIPNDYKLVLEKISEYEN